MVGVPFTFDWLRDSGQRRRPLARYVPILEGLEARRLLSFSEFSLPTPARALAITAGPDGNLWFTEPTANQIGMITPDGQITEYQVPTPNSHPEFITAGPDGNIWFTEPGTVQIGQVVLNDGGLGHTPMSPKSAPPVQAVQSAAVHALFAGAQADPLRPVVVNQQRVLVAVDAALSTSRPNAASVPTTPEAQMEPGRMSHLHDGDQAVTHDNAGLTDPFTEAR